VSADSCLFNSAADIFLGRLTFFNVVPEAVSSNIPNLIKYDWYLEVSELIYCRTAALILFSNNVYTASTFSSVEAIISLCNSSPRIDLKKRKSLAFLFLATGRSISLDKASSDLKYPSNIALISSIPLEIEVVETALPILIIHSREASPGIKFKYQPDRFKFNSWTKRSGNLSLADDFCLPFDSLIVPLTYPILNKSDVPSLRILSFPNILCIRLEPCEKESVNR